MAMNLPSRWPHPRTARAQDELLLSPNLDLGDAIMRHANGSKRTSMEQIAGFTSGWVNRMR
jgi:hypothetical protein